MPRTPKCGTPDQENPEWTADESARSMKFHQLPIEVQRAALALKEDAKHRSKAGQRLSVPLSQDVVAALRATGRGWQTRANDVLRTHFVGGQQEGHK